jgi:hypothetical protein
MNDRQFVDDRLVRYLLGEALTDAEQAEIEERYFTDDIYFDRLLAVEDDLIDSYVQGTLSAGERAQFEQNFLASNLRREKWEAPRAIASFFRARSEPTGFLSAWQFFRSRTPGMRMLATGSALAMIVAVIALGWVIRILAAKAMSSRPVWSSFKGTHRSCRLLRPSSCSPSSSGLAVGNSFRSVRIRDG